MKRVAALCIAAVATHAAPTADERLRIAGERAAIEHRHAAEVQACRSQFVVTTCVDEAQQRRRSALAGVRADEIALNDGERRERAAKRQRDIDRRTQEAAARPPPPPPAERASERPHTPPKPLVVREPRLSEPNAARAAAARASAAARRSDEAAADREKIAAREARRDAKTKKAAPLPERPEIPP